jgi:hypothetical protein
MTGRTQNSAVDPGRLKGSDKGANLAMDNEPQPAHEFRRRPNLSLMRTGNGCGHIRPPLIEG